MKKVLSGVLVIALGLVFAGCNTTPKETETESVLTQISNYLKTYDYDSATSKLKELESSGDTTQVNQAKYMIAQSYYDTERYEQAFTLFKELGSYQGADTFLHDKVMSLYSKGDISIDMALSYVTAYDLLGDKEKAFVDFLKNYMKDLDNKKTDRRLIDIYKNYPITGVLYTDLRAIHEDNTSEGYIIWDSGMKNGSDIPANFFYLKNGLIDSTVTQHGYDKNYLGIYSPDNSYDIDMINKAIEEAE